MRGGVVFGGDGMATLRGGTSGAAAWGGAEGVWRCC